jgi:hypothetical protein
MEVARRAPGGVAHERVAAGDGVARRRVSRPTIGRRRLGSIVVPPEEVLDLVPAIMPVDLNEGLGEADHCHVVDFDVVGSRASPARTIPADDDRPGRIVDRLAVPDEQVVNLPVVEEPATGLGKLEVVPDGDRGRPGVTGPTDVLGGVLEDAAPDLPVLGLALPSDGLLGPRLLGEGILDDDTVHPGQHEGHKHVMDVAVRDRPVGHRAH